MKNIFFLITLGLVIISCGKDDPSTSCSDGILNGDETGVDCGGNSCNPCDILGCIDPTAHNFNINATTDDGSCETCTDGIQNGNETDIDCGGVCDACPDKEALLLGSWKVESFVGLGGSDLIGANREELHFEFLANGDMPVFSHFTNGVNAVGNRAYTIGTDFDLSFFFDGDQQVMVNCEFTNNDNTLTLSGIWLGEPVNATLTRVTQDLCSGVDCNDGTCYYGYCVCPSGIDGENCEVSYGPGGGIVFYDKGSFSNGWRYIEVYPELQDELPISCSNVEGNFGVDDYGAGAVNTIQLSILCNNVNGHAANTALGLNLNGFDDWYIPSRIELIAIYDFNKYLLDYPTDNVSYDIHNSLYADTDHYWIKFRSNTYEGNVSTVNLSRQYFVIRYF